MKRTIHPVGDPRILAALHPTGRMWRVVVARRMNGHVQLVESREFSSDEQTMIETWLDQQQVGRIIVVLPASKVICRTVTLPDAPAEQLTAALSLQAETHLLGTAPPHRMASAALHQARGESTRVGLLLAWPEVVEGPTVPVNRELSYTADVASIAALVDGERVDEPILWADRSDGSLAFALCHAGGVVFRAARESAADQDGWVGGIGRLLAESALNANHTEDFTEMLVEGAATWLGKQPHDAGRLLLTSSVQEGAAKRLEGSSKSDAAWWSKFGVAAGAILATLDQLDSLTQMRREAPIETPKAIDRVTNKLSTRRAAARWLVAAILALAFAPLVFAGMRVLVLQLRVGSLDELNAQTSENESRFVIYEQLSQNTWPMGKLLADIANAAPQGVSIEQVSLDEDGEQFDVRGEATTDTLVLEFRMNLVEAGLFHDVAIDYNKRDPTSSAYKMTVSGGVRNAYRQVQYPVEEDFAFRPLGRRLYGDRFVWDFLPSSTRQDPATLQDESTAVVPVENSGDGGRASSGSSAIGDTTGATGNRVTTNDASSSSGSSDPLVEGRVGPRAKPNIPSVAQAGGENDGPRGPTIPDPLSKEQIVAMNKRDLLSALGKISTAKRQAGLSEEQKTILDEQFELMKSQLRNASD